MSGYKTTCPQCGGKNLWVTPHNNVKYCYNCAYLERDTSAPVKPIKRYRSLDEIRGFYKEVSDYYHSCLTAEHRNWLYSRGISDHSISTYKLGYCPPDIHLLYRSKTAKSSGLVLPDDTPSLAGRITFPFYAEGFVTDVWGRSLNPDETVRYRGPAFPAYSRGADYTYLHDCAYKPEAYNRLVRTEGLIKAILSNQYGIPCVGNPGTLSHRSGTIPMVNQVQVLCYDNQRDNRRQLIFAIKKEAERYQQKRIAVLPLRSKSKSDIDSYIFTYGIDDYRRVIDGALDYDMWCQLVK